MEALAKLLETWRLILCTIAATTPNSQALWYAQTHGYRDSLSFQILIKIVLTPYIEAIRIVHIQNSEKYNYLINTLMMMHVTIVVCGLLLLFFHCIVYVIHIVQWWGFAFVLICVIFFHNLGQAFLSSHMTTNKSRN